MSPSEIENIMADCGGTPRVTGGQRIWDFGCRPSDPVMTDQATIPFEAGEDVPLITSDKVFLWEYLRIANGGKLCPLSMQLTGSCVKSGAENAAIVRTAIECITLARAEAFIPPSTLAAYGYSRHLLGDDSEGEGSSGDQMARALQLVGANPQNDPSLPRPTLYDAAFVYTRDIELQYSSWPRVPQAVRDAAKPHTFQFAVVKTLEEAETELRRGRPLTWAGNWGGRMQCEYRGSGENRILWNGDREDTWNHQQAILGMWRHPDFGRLWYLQNNWFTIRNGVAVPVHGQPANGEPPGGSWIGDAAMQYQLNYRFGEVRSLRDFSGYTNGLIHFGNV